MLSKRAEIKTWNNLNLQRENESLILARLWFQAKAALLTGGVFIYPAHYLRVLEWACYDLNQCSEFITIGSSFRWRGHAAPVWWTSHTVDAILFMTLIPKNKSRIKHQYSCNRWSLRRHYCMLNDDYHITVYIRNSVRIVIQLTMHIWLALTGPSVHARPAQDYSNGY